MNRRSVQNRIEIEDRERAMASFGLLTRKRDTRRREEEMYIPSVSLATALTLVRQALRVVLSSRKSQRYEHYALLDIEPL